MRIRIVLTNNQAVVLHPWLRPRQQQWIECLRNAQTIAFLSFNCTGGFAAGRFYATNYTILERRAVFILVQVKQLLQRPRILGVPQGQISGPLSTLMTFSSHQFRNCGQKIPMNSLRSMAPQNLKTALLECADIAERFHVHPCDFVSFMWNNKYT